LQQPFAALPGNRLKYALPGLAPAINTGQFRHKCHKNREMLFICKCSGIRLAKQKLAKNPFISSKGKILVRENSPIFVD
jgi:hypothetical protein